MRTNSTWCIGAAVLVSLCSPALCPGTGTAADRTPTRASRSGLYGALPIHFEENRGQADQRVRFLYRGRGHSLFLTPADAVLVLSSRSERRGDSIAGSSRRRRTEYALRMKLVGSRLEPQVIGLQQQPGSVNHVTGKDPAQWRLNIPTYAAVKYEAVYPGIDLVFHGNQGTLEYDFVVSPGADPRLIRLEFEGDRPQGEELSVDKDRDGDLVLAIGGIEVRWRRPLIYQETGGARRKITGSFLVGSNNEVRFEVGPYRVDKPLVIDPALVYSTYLGGGSAMDDGAAIAVDDDGNAYITGTTRSGNFPTENPLQEDQGGEDVFVTKLDPTGTNFVYSTYLGGNNGDFGQDIVVDADGCAYITGFTSSNDFPTENAFQADKDVGTDCFVTKLSADGSAVVYSTFLGGPDTDSGASIAVDADGCAYVTGSTSSKKFPTENAFQAEKEAGTDCFVTKLTSDGSVVVYSTFLGGKDGDSGTGIAVGPDGCAYVTGSTSSNDFPTANAFQDERKDQSDCFLSKLAIDGSSLVYSTFLGGSRADSAASITVDSTGNAYLIGTTSSNNFPVASPLQSRRGGGQDAFVSKFDSVGSLLYSTYLGENDHDVGADIALGADGSIFIVGHTFSDKFPTEEPFQADMKGPSDGFLSRLDAAGTAFIYSTFLGGDDFDSAFAIDVDAQNNAYVTGETMSLNFPLTRPMQDDLNDEEDGFVTKVIPLSARDLAVSAIKVPKSVKLSEKKPSRTKVIKVTVQNRSPSVEVIADLATLENLLSLTVESLEACPDIIPVLQPPRKGFPIVLEPKKKLTISFEVTVDCANDPAKSSKKDPDHEDYRCVAVVDRTALDGETDTHPADDVCPRDALPSLFDPNPDGTIRDSGCGNKRADGTLGADVLLDVRVQGAP